MQRVQYFSDTNMYNNSLLTLILKLIQLEMIKSNNLLYF
jgi:hypothetical protein